MLIHLAFPPIRNYIFLIKNFCCKWSCLGYNHMKLAVNWETIHELHFFVLYVQNLSELPGAFATEEAVCMIRALQAKQMQSEQNHSRCLNAPRRGTGTKAGHGSFGKLLRCNFGVRIALTRSAVSERVGEVWGWGTASLKAAAGSRDFEIGKSLLKCNG